MTPEDQAIFRALCLEVRQLRRDVDDARERIKVLDNLQGLESQAIRRINERLLFIDVSEAFEEWEEGIPEGGKH